MQATPYLSFNGNCAEAMRFYAGLLGAELDMMTYGEMPPMPDAPAMPDAVKNRVAHAALMKDGAWLLLAADYVPEFSGGAPYTAPQGMDTCLNLDTVAEGARIFTALSEGGQVRMPYAPTFWAESFGMVTDRFGTPWMINVGLKECA